MKTVSLYLIVCSLLLATGAAQNGGYDSTGDIHKYDSSGRMITDSGFPMEEDTGGQSALNLSNQTELNPIDQETIESVIVSDGGPADDSYNSLFESYSQIPNVKDVTNLAFPTSDLNGDDAADLLVINISGRAESGAFNSSISTLSGADGSILWQKEYPGSLVYAMTVGDQNGDGRDDIMIDQVVSEQDLGLFSSVSLIGGGNGMEIWSRPQMMAMTVAYPVKDTDGDDAPEILVHTFLLDSINNSFSTRISRVSGASGRSLDERIFSGALAIEYPAGNLTSDKEEDSIIAIYQMNGSMSGEMKDALMSINATRFEATNGKRHTELWEQSFVGPALALPLVDLTGDKIDEMAIYLIRPGQDASVSNDMAVLQGSDGEILWQKSFEGFMAIGVPGADLTGEGKSDLVIYKLNGSEESEVLAVKGDDGRLLWSKEGLIYLPSDLLRQDLLSFLPASI